MKKMVFVFIIALACSTAAMAADIAFYVGQWNTDGWYDATQFDDVETIISETGHLFQDIQQFDDTQLDAFGAWVDDNTDDGELDIIWLNGCTPSVLYPNPNVQSDGSRAEEWLDNGNMIINVGDWFAYCTYETGSRGTDNGSTGAQNILDLSGPIAGSGQGQMVVTPAGQEYLPSLNAVTSDRPVVLSAVQAPWEVAVSFAENAAGTHADPVVLHNTETDGYFVAVNQGGSGNWIDDRGLTCAEFIGNWVNEVIGLGVQPLAGSPKPKNESMISQTTVMLEWRAGAFASVHDVYFGESFEAVEAATPDDPNVFVGTVSTEMLRVGSAGDPVPDALVPGQTYYWRVDEVNDIEPNSPWKGNIWSFMVQPVIAYNPAPADGVPYVLLDPDLTWEAGMGVLFHTVYFGESFEEVDAMMFGGWMVADTTVAPASPQLFGPLQAETTYYWRVDEFAMTGCLRSRLPNPTLWAGGRLMKAWEQPRWIGPAMTIMAPCLEIRSGRTDITAPRWNWTAAVTMWTLAIRKIGPTDNRRAACAPGPRPTRLLPVGVGLPPTAHRRRVGRCSSVSTAPLSMAEAMAMTCFWMDSGRQASGTTSA